MNFTKALKPAILASGAVAMAMTMVTVDASAADPKAKKKEKCYGVVAKGQNDCASASHSCAGQAKTDAAADEWMYLPKGHCERIVGGKITKA